MNLLLPAALGFLALVPLIVLFYMLRVQRQDVIVPSLMLWRELKEEASERMTWRPPLKNILLLLQILTALLLALALARPSILTAMRAQSNLVLLVDASASMQATDLRPTRFAEAKRQARAILNTLNSDDTATIVRVADRPTVVGAGSDKQLLLKALDDMTPGVGGGDMKTALLMAKSLARAGASNQIQIFSDGGFTGTDDVQDIPATVKLNLVGRESNNQAVLSVSARPVVAGGARCEGFARVANFADRDVSFPLVALVDGSLIEQRTVQLPARGQTDLWFDLPAGSRLLDVRINPGDALPLDDSGQALCPRERQNDVILVSDAPTALQTALNLLPNVKLSVVPSAQYSPGRQADLYIFEGTVPEKLPVSAGNLLVVGPKSGGQLFTVEGASSSVNVVRSDAGSPLLQSIDAGAIQLNRVARFQAPEWGRVVAETEEGPLLVMGEREGRRIVVFAFELDQVNLPAKLQFPLLVANGVNWLSPEPVPARVGPGQPVVIQPVAGVNEVFVERPNGESETIQTKGEAITYARTETLGRFRVTQRNGSWVGSEEQFVVGPPPEGESRIRPNAEVNFHTVEPAAAGLRNSAGQEIWQVLAIFGLGLLGVEWWWFHFKR